MTAFVTSLLLLIQGMTGADTGVVSQAERINAAVQNHAAHSQLWPGFDPASIPLMIVDGQVTWLFQHPNPPSGFSDHGSGWRFDGHYSDVVANSTARINQITTATLLLPKVNDQSDAEWAATAIHEGFHAHQRDHHPDWMANEALAFEYPLEDLELLVHRRMETLALHRALTSSDLRDQACWARAALNHRQFRQMILRPGLSEYESKTELNEGLATYVQLLALGQRQSAMAEETWPLTSVRERLYQTGAAWAMLLDVFDKNWQTGFIGQTDNSLDSTLSEVLPRSEQPCDLSDTRIAAIRAQAEHDINQLISTREQRSHAFKQIEGQRLWIDASMNPGWPETFDPMNVEPLNDVRHLIHNRMLRLSGQNWQLALLNQGQSEVQVLTQSAGQHPLFDGLDRIEIAGLKHPVIERSGDIWTLRADGFSLTLPAGMLKVNGPVWIATLH